MRKKKKKQIDINHAQEGISHGHRAKERKAPEITPINIGPLTRVQQAIQDGFC
jgi:hypothetical protein